MNRIRERRPLPPFPGYFKLLGPGIVFLALAQGSAELIWWPYLTAKYGLMFIFLLLPSCLIQWPLTYEIGKYTLLTGETIWQGFIRLNRFIAFFLWVLMIVQFFWFGAFVSAGATATAEIFNFPHGTKKFQTLFWAYITIFIYFVSLLFVKKIYDFIEKVMWFVSIGTFIGLLISVLNFWSEIPKFIKGIFIPFYEVKDFQREDITKLLTSIAFAGLGGFWTLFYSYWLREKGVGMAKYFGKLTGLRGEPVKMPEVGFLPLNGEIKKWKRFLTFDSGVGIIGNLITTYMTSFLAYVILYPRGEYPQGWDIAVVQAEFFRASMGEIGRIIFLFSAALFLSDTWLSTVDAVSRVNTDVLMAYFPVKKSPKFWYYFFIVLFTIITSITMPLKEPATLILLSAVIGFFGTVIFTFLTFFLMRQIERETKIKSKNYLLLFVGFIYLSIFIAYIVAEITYH